MKYSMEIAIASIQKQNRWTTILVILINLLIAIIVSAIFWAITGVYTKESVHTAIYSSIAGLLVWSYILLKTRAFDMFFIQVESNWGIILSNQLKTDNFDEDLANRISMERRTSMREIHHGYNGKFPWEIVHETFELKSEIVIGEPLKVYTSDDVGLTIVWQAILTPLIGYLQNLSRKDEKAAIDFFTGFFQGNIIAWCHGKTAEEISSKVDELKSEFAHLLGGSGNVSDTEKQYGLFTNDPQIISVERSDAYQKAAEGFASSKKLAQSIGVLRESAGANVDPNMVLVAATSMSGGKLENTLVITGLNDAKASDVHKLIAAAGAKFTQQSTQQGSKGSK